MKIRDLSNNSTNTPDHSKSKKNLNFGSGLGFSALNLAGSSMQAIQNGGFLASFLIQDFLGMTVPRVGAAFLRDKDVTGQYNVQEGMEVFGREALTGPCMMAVAPIMFALAALWGKSTSVNSQLIKRMGNSLKEIFKNTELKNFLVKDRENFKRTFYKKNVEEMLSNTLGKENVKEESVNYILEQLSNYENAQKTKKLFKKSDKKKYLDNIVKYINDLKYTNGSDLDMLGKVKVGSEELKNIKTFSTEDAMESMIKYSNDALSFVEDLSKYTESKAEELKNRSLFKRYATNIATLGATIGVLSVLPKLYLKSDVSPSAKLAQQMKENQENKNENTPNISFKGKESSIIGRIGKFISEHLKEGLSSELEYNGHNFTNTLMAGLSLFAMLPPRVKRAFDRAPINEDGKKDRSEINEILLRDISSSLAVVFAVPMLTRAFVSSYEKKLGFVLLDKDRSKSGFKSFIDLLNPYSSAHVLSNKEIDSIYNNVNTREKMVNFCKYIEKNGGDLEKILSKSEFCNELLENEHISLKNMKNLTKAEKNKQILEYFEKNIERLKLDKNALNESIQKLMKGNSPKANKIFAYARGLNSIPALLTTVFISPYILGWFIPRLTYANTRKMHEKAEKEKLKNINA